MAIKNGIMKCAGKWMDPEKRETKEASPERQILLVPSCVRMPVLIFCSVFKLEHTGKPEN